MTERRITFDLDDALLVDFHGQTIPLEEAVRDMVEGLTCPATDAIVEALDRALTATVLLDGTPVVRSLDEPTVVADGYRTAHHYARVADAASAEADRVRGALRSARDETLLAQEATIHARDRQHAAERERDEARREAARLRALIDSIHRILAATPRIPAIWAQAKTAEPAA